MKIKSGNDYKKHAALDKVLAVEEWKAKQAIAFCKEVLIMCNLSQGVKAEGREEGKKRLLNIFYGHTFHYLQLGVTVDTF